MINQLHINDALAVKRVQSRLVDIIIDGDKVDTFRVVGSLHPGMTLDSDAVDAALQGRTVVDIFFTGEIVNVVTEPEEE
jgi:hypothetical protein